MKVIIAGSRSINNLGMVCEAVKTFQTTHKIQVKEVVSGTARGADKLGERWAENNNIPIKRFPANWKKYGKSAGYKRNIEMAEYAEGCIVLWDGESKGSKHMINIAREYELVLLVMTTAWWEEHFGE